MISRLTRFLYQAFDLGEKEEGVRSGSWDEQTVGEEVLHGEENSLYRLHLCPRGILWASFTCVRLSGRRLILRFGEDEPDKRMQS